MCLSPMTCCMCEPMETAHAQSSGDDTRAVVQRLIGARTVQMRRPFIVLVGGESGPSIAAQTRMREAANERGDEQLQVTVTL